jgi:excisionase family DNA binding protein
MDCDVLLNVEQVAKMLGVSQAAIRKWVLNKTIPYLKLNGLVRFSLPDIREWQKKRTVVPVENKTLFNKTNFIDGGVN